MFTDLFVSESFISFVATPHVVTSTMATVRNLKIFAIIIFCASLLEVRSLECYVCENQEDNSEKCVKSIEICDYNQDVCLTEIKWGSTPYWSQGAKKQYYVSKRCSNKTECATNRQRFMHLCTHIWYQDWICGDCCQGDRCNYYIISGSDHNIPKISLVLGGVICLLYKVFFIYNIM